MTTARAPGGRWRWAGLALVGLGLLAAALFLVRQLGASWSLVPQDNRAVVAVPDTLGYYTGARLVAAGQGARLYDVDALSLVPLPDLAGSGDLQTRDPGGRVLPFEYPPFVLLLFLPLTLLPLREAMIVWGVVNWLLMVALVATCVGVAAGHAARQRWAWILAVGTFVPVAAAAVLGQLSLALALAVFSGWAVLRRGHPVLAGLALSGLLIKPQYAPLVLLAIVLQRRWGPVAGVGLGIAGAGLLSVAAVGWEGVLAYVRLLPQVERLGQGYAVGSPGNYTWRGLSLRLLGEGTPADITWLVLTALTVLVAVVIWWPSTRSPRGLPPGVPFAGLLVGAVLVSPHTLIHDLTLLVPAAVLGWRGLRDSGVTGRLAAVWLGLCALIWGILLLPPVTGQGLRPEVTVPLVVPLMAAALVLLAFAARAGPSPSPSPGPQPNPGPDRMGLGLSPERR